MSFEESADLSDGSFAPESNEKRYRKWQFTLNNYTDSDIKAFDDLTKSGVCRGLWQYEVGQQKSTPHMQGYLAFGDAVSFSRMKKFNSRCNWRVMGNKWEIAVRNYCTKSHTASGLVHNDFSAIDEKVRKINESRAAEIEASRAAEMMSIIGSVVSDLVDNVCLRVAKLEADRLEFEQNVVQWKKNEEVRKEIAREKRMHELSDPDANKRRIAAAKYAAIDMEEMEEFEEIRRKNEQDPSFVAAMRKKFPCYKTMREIDLIGQPAIIRCEGAAVFDGLCRMYAEIIASERNCEIDSVIMKEALKLAEIEYTKSLDKDYFDEFSQSQVYKRYLEQQKFEYDLLVGNVSRQSVCCPRKYVENIDFPDDIEFD